MKIIGMIGMGRMGQAISDHVKAHPDITLVPFNRISKEDEARLKACHVVIEFTTPTAAPVVIRQCLELGIRVVSGTTGWHEYHLDSILSYCSRHHASLLYASNFSIGMNIVFALNMKLAAALKPYTTFKPSIKEVHHIHKKDSPSGTAHSLLEQIMQQRHDYTGFTLNDDQSAGPHQIPVEAIREGEVKGYHEVTWQSPDERISIAHEAFDRRIFASGAVLAAQWLMNQPAGVYTMQDLIHL